jgi:hypothetical protein
VQVQAGAVEMAKSVRIRNVTDNDSEDGLRQILEAHCREEENWKNAGAEEGVLLTNKGSEKEGTK